MSDGYLIREEGERRYFAMIPNLIDDIGLSQKAYRLYGHIKRVAGEEGRCIEGVDAMGKTCGMAKNSVVAAKRELEQAELIEITASRDRTRPDEIVILDVWERNNKHFNQGQKEERGANEGTRVAQTRERDAAQTRERKKNKREELKEEEGKVSYLNPKVREALDTLLQIKAWDKNKGDTQELVALAMQTYPHVDVVGVATNLAFKIRTGAVTNYKKPSKAFSNWVASENGKKREAQPTPIRSQEVEMDAEALEKYYATMPEGLRR